MWGAVSLSWIKSSRYLNRRPLVPEEAGIMSNYTKTAIINPASSSPGATAQMSWVEIFRIQESADDVSLPVVYPHTLITLLVLSQITQY